MANKQGVCSTTPHLQQHYIRAAEDISKEEHIRSRPKSPQATPDIQAVIKLQDRLGRWDESEALWDALGGHVPEPPYGIVGWRWATALAVAYMRRSPDQQHFCEHAYSKAQEWLQPPWLLKVSERERERARITTLYHAPPPHHPSRIPFDDGFSRRATPCRRKTATSIWMRRQSKRVSVPITRTARRQRRWRQRRRQ